MYKSLIYIIFLSFLNSVNAQKINVEILTDAVIFMENGDSILVYQTAEKSLNGKYARANYIHPLYALDGQVLTEDFPSDHPHQRGIFWAWHQLYIGDKRIGDAWKIEDFGWEVKSVKTLGRQGRSQAVQAEVFWKSPQWTDDDGNEKEVVRELTTIKVYPAENAYRQIDIEISLYALEKNMRIGGYEDKKGYGGFSARIHLAEDMKFTGSEGIVIPDNLPLASGGWMDISGSVGRGGSIAGLSILCHTDNPGYPNPWILRSARSMQNAVYPFPGAIAVPLSMIQPTTLRYRLLIHEGSDEALDIPTIHANFGKQ